MSTPCWENKIDNVIATTIKVKVPRKEGQYTQRYAIGGRGWIRTTEAEATDLQSAPFGHSGTLPFICFSIFILKQYWSWWTDSNPRPADYKSAALPTELHQRISNARIIISLFFAVVNTLNNFFTK